MRTSAISGALVAALTAALALPATTSADTGGAAMPSGGAEAGSPGFELSSKRSVWLGSAVRVRGEFGGAARRTVTIQRRVGEDSWTPVASVTADERGSFVASWTPGEQGKHVLRAVIGGGEASASAAGASQPRAVVAVRPAMATWYGPGFYGRRTACGTTLTTRTLGVAHRSLPCGTRVTLTRGGRSVTARVIDRGPFADGYDWDLTAATAKRLGFASSGRIGFAVLD
jgi:hypothetical protein